MEQQKNEQGSEQADQKSAQMIYTGATAADPDTASTNSLVQSLSAQASGLGFPGMPSMMGSVPSQPMPMPMGMFQWQAKLHGIKRIPAPVMQRFVFGLLSSRDLFNIRGVCSNWSDQVKGIWCQVVKDEMLEQVHSLDLLYEKETTAKLLEFKLKYLVSYANLMSNYFSHMNFTDIVAELISLDDSRASHLMLIAAMVVGPKERDDYPTSFEEIQDEHIAFAQEYLTSESFQMKFQSICTMDSIPEVSLQQMKVIKTQLMDRVITPTLSEELGNAARLLSSWLDGILEFTILKHEVIVLRLKNSKVLEKIRGISRLWPQKKAFIEGAYKILLFTKNQRRQVNHAFSALKQASQAENGQAQLSYQFMNYEEAQNRVVKRWYQQRIQEETAKNQRLRELHESLTKLKLLKQQQQMGASQTDQEIVSGRTTTMDVQAAQAKLQHSESQLAGSAAEAQDSATPATTQITLKDQDRQREALQNQIDSLKEQIASKQQEIETQRSGEEQKQGGAENADFETQLHQRWQHVEDRIHMRDSDVDDSAANQELSVVQRPPAPTLQGATGEQSSQMQNAALFQSQLLTQMLQVGSLFSQRAQLEEEEAQKKQQRIRLKEECARKRRLKRKLKEAQQQHDPTMVVTSSDSDEDNEEMHDPQIRLQLAFEEHLKKRIFLADRIEKVEKALVSMNLISKDVFFCSDFEFTRFQEALAQPGALQQLIALIEADQEDVWFDLYRTITSSREMAERQVERQIVKQQRKQQRGLKRKKLRLQAIKESFMRSELIVQELQKECKTKRDRIKVRRARATSAPCHLNLAREAIQQQRIMMHTQELLKAQEQHQQAQGALNELSNIVASLAAVRYMLNQVDQAEDAQNQIRQDGDGADGGNPEESVGALQSQEGQIQMQAEAMQQVARLLIESAQSQQAALQDNIGGDVAASEQPANSQQPTHQEMAIQTDHVDMGEPAAEDGEEENDAGGDNQQD